MSKARELSQVPNSSTFKNRIINGAMQIDQRNAGASITVNGTGNYYAVDRFACSGEAADGVYTIQRSTLAPTGFINSLLATVTTADTSLGVTQRYFVSQNIEGFNVADLGWGTASASAVTISFWVRSSVTGTFGGVLTNDGYNRSYPFTYTINATNTFEYKTVTIAGDTTGTWNTGNSAGIRLVFGLGTGSSYSGTAGAWSGNTYLSATGATNLMATNGATFYITGVQLEKGSTATSFDYRPYGTELALCQRYAWVPDGNASVAGVASSTTSIQQRFVHPVQMRVAPSITIQTSGAYTISDDFNGDYTATTVTLSSTSVSQNLSRLQLGGFTGLTQARYYGGLPGGGWTSRFLFSSEL